MKRTFVLEWRVVLHKPYWIYHWLTSTLGRVIWSERTNVGLRADE